MPHEVLGPDAVLQRGTSDHLVVAFSSLSAHYRKRFDGETLFKGRPEHVPYLRDMTKLAYHTGLTGISASVPETVEFLNYVAGRLRVRRRTFYGASTGGYGAILHGLFCGVDDVLTVNPTVFVAEDLARDLACPAHPLLPLRNFTQHYAALGQPLAYGDLAREIRSITGPTPMICVHYASQNRRDQIGARHLAACEGVFAIPHATADHNHLPSTLAKMGVLQDHVSAQLSDLKMRYVAQVETQSLGPLT